MNKPTMVIIAGANGSGKSSNTLSFAQQGYDVIDPDRIARNLSPEKAAVSAGKSAINRARENIYLGNSFTIETTLASKGVYQRLVNEAINSSFDIKLMYISTVSPDININRVASRVAKGGITYAKQNHPALTVV
ncbi:zeta toxin family protein [Photobacterium damselae]|uniref:zeta toxin family protein n=1 Tax=Photobacterium damselae TaxID=38293 RepID=UPI0040683747